MPYPKDHHTRKLDFIRICHFQEMPMEEPYEPRQARPMGEPFGLLNGRDFARPFQNNGPFNPNHLISLLENLKTT
jgi:hypothetical protein